MKHTDVRTRLLAAARDQFARHGFDGASVRDITRKARANLGAVTYHFGSKLALYHAVLEEMAAPFADRVAAAAALDGSPLDRVEGMVRTYLAQFRDYPEMPTFVLREMAGGGPLPPPIARALDRNAAALVGAVLDGQRDGSIRPGDPKLLGIGIISQPFHLGVAGRLLHRFGIDTHDAATWQRITDHVVGSVRASLAVHQETA